MTGIAFPAPDPAILARKPAIVAGLRRLVAAPDAVIDDPVELAPYETDAFTAYRRLPLAVVLPGSTEEVSRVLAYLAREGVPVVPRGAGTSLSGGAIPLEDAVVLGVARMNRVLAIDPANRTAQIGRASCRERV